jgi:hypothetical protein
MMREEEGRRREGGEEGTGFITWYINCFGNFYRRLKHRTSKLLADGVIWIIVRLTHPFPLGCHCPIHNPYYP